MQILQQKSQINIHLLKACCFTFCLFVHLFIQPFIQILIEHQAMKRAKQTYPCSLVAYISGQRKTKNTSRCDMPTNYNCFENKLMEGIILFCIG